MDINNIITETRKWTEFCIKQKYKDFTGRAGRAEYWYFTLALWVVYIALSILGSIPAIGVVFSLISLVLSLATLAPALAVGARRLHDVNKSGWWQLLYLTGIGGLVVLYFLVQPSQPEDNKFGAANVA